MKNKPVFYRVYNRKGEYHHGYSATLDGSIGWAIDCAKTVNGFVKEVFSDKTEKEIFNCQKKTKKTKQNTNAKLN